MVDVPPWMRGRQRPPDSRFRENDVRSAEVTAGWIYDAGTTYRDESNGTPTDEV